jgi:hypothetical protein
MEIMRYRYGRMGRGEGRRETKGKEDGRKNWQKRNYHMEKEQESGKNGITYICNVYGGGGENGGGGMERDEWETYGKGWN